MKPWLLPIILLVTAAGGAATVTMSTARPALEQVVYKPQSQLPAFEAEVPPLLPKNGPEVAFKWQDNQGAWHYADQPPTDTPTQALMLDPSTAVLGQHSSPAPENGSGARGTPES